MSNSIVGKIRTSKNQDKRDEVMRRQVPTLARNLVVEQWEMEETQVDLSTPSL